MQTAKRTATFSLKIPERTKLMIDELSGQTKKAMLDHILTVMAYWLHQDTFNPSVYLNDE
jgi:hypothetical protein